MRARISTVVGPVDRLDETSRLVREQTVPLMHRLEGFRGLDYLLDRATGRAVVVTLWESEAAMAASEPLADHLRRESAKRHGEQILGVDHLEVAVHTRAPERRPTPPRPAPPPAP